jgi:hypothetical protein
MVRRLVLAGLGAALAATLVAGAGTPAGAGPAPAEQPLWGIVMPQAAPLKASLVRLDPRTLAPFASPRLAVGRFYEPLGRSPDGALLALLDRQAPALRIVDLARMRALGDVRLPARPGWRLRTAAWLTADRVVVVLQGNRGAYKSIVGAREVLVVDPLARRVLARRPFADLSALVGSAPAGDKLVLLLGRGDLAGGPARLVVVGSDGRFTDAGVVDRGPGRELRNSSLVVDPAGSRALVVTAGAPIAELDLRTMQLEHRSVPGTFLARRGRSLRNAIWIDERTIAVSGYDNVVTGRRRRTTGSGLALVDTERWTTRVVDSTAGSTAYGGGVLLVFGMLEEANDGRGQRGRGLTAYGLDGSRRWHAFGSQHVSAQPVRGIARVFVTPVGPRVPGTKLREALVDLTSGRTLPRTAAIPGSNLFVLPEPPAAKPKRAPAAVPDLRTEGPAVVVDGDGLALTGSVRADVTRLVVVRADGAELELQLDAEGTFTYRAGGAEHAARTLRAETAGRGVLSTVRIAEPRCGGAGGPCPQAAAAPTGPGSFALLPRGRATALVEVDPRTLRPVPGRTRVLAGERYLSARSPDGRLLAVPGLTGRLDVVDLARLRNLVPMWMPAPGWTVRAVGWLTNDRLAAVVQRMRPPYRPSVAARALVVLDTTGSRVVARRPLTNKLAVGQAVAAGGRFVLLLRSSDHRGSTVQLVVADARGDVRTTELEVGQSRGVLRATALTVEPDGSRAYVFPFEFGRAAASLLEIDLDTLRSTRHPLLPAPGAEIRPALVVGAPGAAVQVGKGRVAVTDLFPLRVNGERRAAAGVFLVDTRTFTARLVDARARSFVVAGERLFTFGRANVPGAELGTGVTAYDLDGRRLYRLYGDRAFDRLVVAGGYGHALPGSSERRRVVFAAAAGRGIGTLPPLPRGFQVVPEPTEQPQREPAGVEDPFSRISNQGTPVPATAETRRTLRRLGISDASTVYRLAVRDGRAFYRLGANRRGVACYSSGRPQEPGLIGSASCASGFPSRVQPVLDFTSVELSRDGSVRLLRAEGIAADAVATIELVDRAGAVLATAPVEENVYVLRPPPRGVSGLVGRAAGGEAVFRRPLPTGRPPRSVRRAVSAYGVRLTYPAKWDAAAYQPRAGVASGPLLMVANIPLPPFRRIEDTASAVRRLGPRGVVILLNEAGAGRRESFPPLGRSLVLRGPYRVTPRGAEKIVSFSSEGRLLQAAVFFGSRRVSAETLRAVNGVLATLRVAHVPTPRGAPLQHGEADGVSVEVYRNIVVFRFASTDSRAYRLVAGSNLGAGCLRVRSRGGTWTVYGSSVLRPFARELAITLGRGVPPPFDACEVSSSHGRRWNDVRGNHAALEVAFNDRARLFFEERAVARDLALFVRSPVLDEVRKAMRRGGNAPSAASIARRVGSRVVALRRRYERPPAGTVGVWSNGGAVLEASELTPRGRRLYVTLRAGRIGGHNVKGLAFVF